MTDYTSQIDAWYAAIQYRSPPASELASFNAQLQSGIITTAQAVSQIEASTYTQTYVDPVIREYQAAFGRVPDQAGVAYWVGQVAANPANLAVLSNTFANSAEFFADYGATATTPASSTLVTALYTNVLGRAPDAAGLAYWSSQPLDAAQLLQAFAQSAEFITDSTPYVVQFQNAEVAGNEPTSGSLFNQAIPGGISANTYTITYGAPTTFTISGVLGGQPITGTVSGGPTGPISSTEAAGNSNVTINAVLGLNNFQSIVFTGINNVLNADYTTGGNSTNSTFPGSNFTQSGLNIQGVQTWNIQASAGTYAGNSEYAYGKIISFAGDAAIGNVISGLQTVNFNDNSGADTLLIGDNSEPVQEPNGANGFAINVSNAVGTSFNGVDVDIAAQAFTGKDTIHVSANIVGGFPQVNGSYVVPTLQLGADSGDQDTYNPNWGDWQDVAFGIASGASASSLTTLNGVTLPPTGAVGFQNWVVASVGAKSVGSVNVLALGNEGSWNAQTITLTDDGSTTFLFATALSDSLSTDWQNITTVNLAGTSGQVIITGAETDAQIALTEGYGFVADGGGGLLTSDTSALVSIKGGTGNSFYDLSSLTLAAAGAASIQGGTSTKGNSEVAFNNSVVANATTKSIGTNINISNIQVLDDTGNPVTAAQILATPPSIWNGQGGIINMANFAGLGPLNTNYELLGNSATTGGTLGNLIGGSVFTSATVAAGNDVAPAGYQLLQLLNADGSTENYLGSNLSIIDGFTQFAINAADVWDGILPVPVYVNSAKYSQNYSIIADYQATPGNIGGSTSGTIDPNGNGAYLVQSSYWDLYSAPLSTLSGYNILIDQQSPVPTVNVLNHLKLWLSDDGVNVYKGSKLVGTIFDAPQVTIDNYTTVDIYLPYESNPGFQGWVVLGSQQANTTNGFIGGFNDNPVASVPVLLQTQATVNFYDNTVDTGGSPPGGPTDLVLGYTNFTADLAPTSNVAYNDPTGTIGYTTVFMTAGELTYLIDHGAGSLEIGATNATNLDAHTTSHLIMDLPAVPQWFGNNITPAALGITVNGSLTGQNLIQGSSGSVAFDTNGHAAPDTGSSLTNGNGVLESLIPSQNYGVGNDVLTGGAGVGDINVVSNAGDNYFPEGGNDTVNLVANHTKAADTIWVASFDVSSTINSGGVLPHYIYGQAVTDIVNGVEHYVDSYGPGVYATAGVSGPIVPQGPSGSATSSLLVNNFVEGNTSQHGDTLVFNPWDWATTAHSTTITAFSTSGITENGLVDAFTGATINPATGVAQLSQDTYIGTTAGTLGGFLITNTTVIEDGISGYQNAAQLAKALSDLSQGAIGFVVAKDTQEHVLVAYNNTVTGGVTIDDVTITNTNSYAITTTAGGHGFSLSGAGVYITAVDMVNIVGTAANPATIGNLDPHNIQFFHG